MSFKYEVEGVLGAELALRPPDSDLELLKGLTFRARLNFANQLVSEGYVIDAVVDVNKWPYWKTMELRREYGYTWVPAVGSENILIAPGLHQPGTSPYDPDNPPIGAILVPASEKDDINYVDPTIVIPPPVDPEIVVDFGWGPLSDPIKGAFQQGPKNTAPIGTHAVKQDIEYVLMRVPGGFAGLTLWVPIDSD